MSPTRLDTLQWFGLLAGPLAWAAHLVAGYFLAEGRCDLAQWHSGWAPAEVAITALAGLVAIAGEAAAATVYRELRRVEENAPGPTGRRRFFAVGGLVGNVLFFTAILLSGVTVVATQACRPA